MDYKTMSLVALKQLAKEKNIKGVSGFRKADLVALLEEQDQKNQIEKETSKEVVKDDKIAYATKEKDKKQAGKEQTSKKQPDKSQDEVRQTGRKQPDKKTILNKPVSKPNNTVTKKTETEEKQQAIRKTAKPDSVKEAETANRTTEVLQNNKESSKEENNRRSLSEQDAGKPANGILEVLPEGFGFIRCENYLPGENDVYVSPAMIRRFNLRTGDILTGITKPQSSGEKFSALLRLNKVNGYLPDAAQRRTRFEELVPIFPEQRIHLENERCNRLPMRIMDLLAPVGKGQRGMIVSPPKAGKTTLLKQIAQSVSRTYRDMVLIVLLIDERPEEVTDIRESIEGNNVEVIYSTFDELPEHHKRVSEMVLERAKRLVEHGKDVMILLDSITRLARAYNLTIPASGRTLSGGLDPAALHMPKKFFGAARNIRNGGSLTILATALVETGSKMDDVVFEEFKGTGNMELVLDRSLSEKRIFPAIDVARSSTRRDDLLLTQKESKAMSCIRRELNSGKNEETTEEILRLFTRTKNNDEFVELVNQMFGNPNGAGNIKRRK